MGKRKSLKALFEDLQEMDKKAVNVALARYRSSMRSEKKRFIIKLKFEIKKCKNSNKNYGQYCINLQRIYDKIPNCDKRDMSKTRVRDVKVYGQK